MHNWKEFVALLIKSYECVPLRLLAMKGSLRSSCQETQVVITCLFVSDGGWKTRESIENTLGEKRGTINKLNQVRSRNLTWATADEGDGCQLRNPCSLHELPDCIRGSDCIMR